MPAPARCHPLPPLIQGKTDRKHAFIRLRAKGVSLKAAAKQLHVGVGTLCEWGKALELEIASARAIELEALQEEFYLLKEKRIQYLGGLLQQLDREMARRDFSDLDTAKLLEHRLKVFQELKGEFTYAEPCLNPFPEEQNPNETEH